MRRISQSHVVLLHNTIPLDVSDCNVAAKHDITFRLLDIFVTLVPLKTRHLLATQGSYSHISTTNHTADTISSVITPLTALLHIHDLTKASRVQKVSCLTCLRRFDTINHKITCLSSCFSIHGCSQLIHHLPRSVLSLIIISHPHIHPPVVFPKTLFSVHYFSSCTLPLSVLSSLPFPLTITLCR